MAKSLRFMDGNSRNQTFRKITRDSENVPSTFNANHGTRHQRLRSTKPILLFGQAQHFFLIKLDILQWITPLRHRRMQNRPTIQREESTMRRHGARMMNPITPSAGYARKPVVAIIGGGFSGAAVAYHLDRLAPGRTQIVVIEPQDDLGRGLAYSADDPSHRINVPAAKMSLLPDDPAHFSRWLDQTQTVAPDHAALMPDGRRFPARRVFGDYVSDALRGLGDRVEHVRSRAHSITKDAAAYRIQTDSGAVQADIVVLAICHPPPSQPAAFPEDVRNAPGFIVNPWLPDAYAGVGTDDRVIIVGTGLTMADIIASLEGRHHRGSVLAISRRGLRSRGHPPAPVDPFGDFADIPIRTSAELVRKIRATIDAAAEAGLSWHAVLDQVRSQGTAIWQALPLQERRRLLRHLRPFWDVHRFRVAPQIEAAIDRRLTDGSLSIRPSSLVSATINGSKHFVVSLRDRRTGRVEDHPADVIILATGPAHGQVFADNPLLTALEREGLARPDPLRLGIDVDRNGRIIDASGAVNPDMLVAGPLARGTIGELMGLPDVAVYAIRIAGEVAQRIGVLSTANARHQAHAAS